MAHDPHAPQPDDTATMPPDGPSDAWADDADPLPDGWADLPLDAAPARPGIDWEALEVAADRVLPGGLRLAGRIEDVRVPLLGDVAVGARLDTGVRRSRIHGTQPVEGEDTRVGVRLDGRVHLLPTREEAGELVVDADVVLGTERMAVVFQVDGRPAEPGLTLGADDLAGRFVVDPGSERRIGEPA